MSFRGAAFLFLETAGAAAQRGARVHAEVLGAGMSNDAHHCSAPEPGGRGLAAAMRRALENAGLSADQISYINAHGTGTEANDKAECKAMLKVLGGLAARTPVSSTKSLVETPVEQRHVASGLVHRVCQGGCAATHGELHRGTRRMRHGLRAGSGKGMDRSAGVSQQQLRVRRTQCQPGDLRG